MSGSGEAELESLRDIIEQDLREQSLGERRLDLREQNLQLKERLRVLSEAMRAFANATPDPQALLETIARRVADEVADCCVVLLLSEDGETLVPAAAFTPDPEAMALVRDALSESILLRTHPVARQVHESGEPFFAAKLEVEAMRPPRTTPHFFAFIERMGVHSLLVVALRAHQRSAGQLVLVRFRPERLPFDAQDIDLAQNLADHATLALSNARLLAAARAERAQGERIAARLAVLTEASREFSATTHDLDHLLEVVARRLGEILGDICVIRMVSPDGLWLESKGAAYHRDPTQLGALREFMLSGRQRVGEGISGRVAAQQKPLLMAEVDAAAFIAATNPDYRPFVERLGVTSAITLPLLCRGQVVGVANFLRTTANHPYTEDDLRFVQSVAEQAALAIGNARSNAEERAAREVAEAASSARQRVEARFARLSECGILGIVVANLDGKIFEINATLLNLLGYTSDEILSGSVAWLKISPPEWREVDARAVHQLTTSGVGALREKEYLRKDGTRVPVLIGSAMTEEGDGNEVISFVLDLTERKEAQVAVRQMRAERAADAQFRGMLEAAPDAMVIVDAGGAIVFVNAQVEVLFGYARKDIIGQAVEILIPEPFRRAHPAHRAQYVRDPGTRRMGATAELFGLRKNGEQFPIEVSLSPLETPNGMLVSSAIRDISERRKSEQQRSRLAAIVDSSDDAIIGSTFEGVITSWNRGALRVFGYTDEEAVGRSLLMLVPFGREDEVRATLKALVGGESKHFDTVRRRKDGHAIDVSVTMSPVRDAAGRVVSISKVARDITERRQAEESLARAKDRAEAANRELEAFSYSVAHDLRAPLRGMNGFAQILLEDYADKLDAAGQDCLQEIHCNAEKMGALIDALLSLSRVTRSDWRPEWLDLSALFRAALAELESSHPERRVTSVIEDGIWARLDAQLTRALVDNLVGNAWKFTSHVSDAKIEFGATQGKDEEAGGTITELAAHPTFTLFIRDNGAGFDMAHATKLFAPFQRVHTVAEFPGTGIGLATVQRIVHRHGGRIWADAQVGKGAAFYFTFPDISRKNPALR